MSRSSDHSICSQQRLVWAWMLRTTMPFTEAGKNPRGQKSLSVNGEASGSKVTRNRSRRAGMLAKSKGLALNPRLSG